MLTQRGQFETWSDDVACHRLLMCAIQASPPKGAFKQQRHLYGEGDSPTSQLLSGADMTAACTL